MTIRALATPWFKRVLIGIAAFDNAGYFTDLGGGGCRIRYGQDGPTLLALPRVPTYRFNEISLQGQPADTIAQLPITGPLDFGIPVGQRRRHSLKFTLSRIPAFPSIQHILGGHMYRRKPNKVMINHMTRALVHMQSAPSTSPLMPHPAMKIH